MNEDQGDRRRQVVSMSAEKPAKNPFNDAKIVTPSTRYQKKKSSTKNRKAEKPSDTHLVQRSASQDLTQSIHSAQFNNQSHQESL